MKKLERSFTLMHSNPRRDVQLQCLKTEVHSLIRTTYNFHVEKSNSLVLTQKATVIYACLFLQIRSKTSKMFLARFLNYIFTPA